MPASLRSPHPKSNDTRGGGGGGGGNRWQAEIGTPEIRLISPSVLLGVAEVSPITLPINIDLSTHALRALSD